MLFSVVKAAGGVSCFDLTVLKGFICSCKRVFGSVRGLTSQRGVKICRIPESAQRPHLLNLSWKFVLKPRSLTTNGFCGALGYIFCKENTILMELVTNYKSLYALKIHGIYRANKLGIWFW